MSCRVKGIYVERLINARIDRLWKFTQNLEFHKRWDMRFSEIQYLPRRSADAPQEFLYETRIGSVVALRQRARALVRFLPKSYKDIEAVILVNPETTAETEPHSMD